MLTRITSKHVRTNSTQSKLNNETVVVRVNFKGSGVREPLDLNFQVFWIFSMSPDFVALSMRRD